MNSTTRRGFFGWMAGAVATLTGMKAEAHWWPSLAEREARDDNARSIQWVSVKDRRPEVRTKCLIHAEADGESSVYSAVLQSVSDDGANAAWAVEMPIGGFSLGHVTHWALLPEPPSLS